MIVVIPNVYSLCFYYLFSSETPQGQLPMLEVDGNVICQSFTIARFIARELSK